MTIERRNCFAPSAIARIETREDGSRMAVGHAAVYYREDDPGTEYNLWDEYYERIMPGAFDDVLSNDVRALFNHDSNIVLGRSNASVHTLRLSLDEVGLRYEIDLPDTQAGRDLAISLERGDVSGSSFSFILADGGSNVVVTEDGKAIRLIRKVGTLYDVGPVTFPAYPATDASARGFEEAAAEFETASTANNYEVTPKRRDDLDIDLRMRMIHMGLTE